MKTIIYSTNNAKVISDFRVEDKTVCSIVNKTKDKHYFRFLYLHQPVMSYPYPSEFSKVLMKELCIDTFTIDNTTELDQFMLANLDALFERAKSSKFLRVYIRSYFKRYQGCFESYKGNPIMILSQSKDVSNISEEFTHELIDKCHCYSILNNKQTNRLYKMHKIAVKKNMIKLVYNTGKNTQVIFNVESAEQAASILNMKEDFLYYDFLLKNQKSIKAKIGPDFVRYILSQLNMDYVQCPFSSCLDLSLIDKAEQLFELAETNLKIKSYLSFNFRLLHRSFMNTVLKPLMVISNYDNCKDLPDTFIQQSINKSICYYDKRISQKDIHSIFDNTMAL